MSSHTNLSILKLCVLLLIWYLISSIANIIGKRLLTIFPHPFTVTLVQLFHGWLYSVPLAMGKLLSQLASQISLRLVPISYTHTVKALMPLFTVVLSRMILAEKHSMTVN